MDEPDFETLAADIRDHYGIELWVRSRFPSTPYEDAIVNIDSLVVPVGKRGQGIASQVMLELTGEADRRDTILALDPSSDFGSSATRLRKFYARFGFVPNKGRRKDFRTRSVLIRYPRR